MRAISPALQAHLDGGATTLCWCWRLEPTSRPALGFTDHDRDIAFDDTVFAAAAGFTASDMAESVGLAPDNLSVTSAFSADALTEADLAAGVYDGAAVAIWRVNWADPMQRVLMRRGTVGEVRRAGARFTAELRGLAAALDVPRGRLFQYSCDAELGDARCRINLVSLAASVLTTDGARAFGAQFPQPDGWFDDGALVWTTGANAGRRGQVKRHAAGKITLWESASEPIGAGDEFLLSPGCDKHFSTCREKFANGLNFRGCPHIPGNDYVTLVARPGSAVHDGGRRL